MTELRIALWKLRFGLHIWMRSHGDDFRLGHYFRMCLGQIAHEGWIFHLECNDDDVAKALNSSPVEAADEELSCWTD